MRSKSILVITALVLALADFIVELQVLPSLYRGIPLPFPETSKPIGNALFSATSLHIALIAINIFVLIAVLKRVGYVGSSIPSRKGDWLDLFAFLAFALSGLVMWFSPVFMLPFIGAGVYLILTDMR